ncbi:MAG: cytochrome c3 family protein, partial [Candidatus Methanoperedens sp.]|nr:cytochrome c3 family protein [Candidatus Methanoperedens sp.]
MKNFISPTLLILLIFQLPAASGFDPTTMNPQSQVHNVHIGPGTVGLSCDTCHGFPPKVIQVQNGSGPGNFIVCENCHAAPPNSFNPSMGNLIVIHLSRGLYCMNCHDTTKITPAHPSTKAENGTVQVIKCENCHANPQNSISHVNGGKYCLDCHGNRVVPTSTPITATAVPTAIYVAPTSTPLTIPVSPTSTVTTSKILVRLDSRRGFIPDMNTIRAGDEIIWRNTDTAMVTLVSSNGLFDAQPLEYDKEYRYVFNKQGTYSFYQGENNNLKGTIVVASPATYTPTPALAITPVPTVPTVKQR